MDNGRIQKRIIPVLLLLILAIGLFVRYDNLNHWFDNKDRYFFNRQTTPLLITVDGYYYLNLAKDLQNNNYQSTDNNRQVPNGYHYPDQPPLLSVLAANIATWTNSSLEWVAIILPLFWGVAIGVATYFLATFMSKGLIAKTGESTDKNHAGAAMALFSTLFVLLSPMLAQRTSIGWFDTDGPNVLFAIGSQFLAIAVLRAETLKEQSGWAMPWLLVSILAIWTWDQSPLAAIFLNVGPMLLAILMITARDPRQIIQRSLPLLFMAIVIGLWKGEQLGISRIFSTITSYLNYFTDSTDNSVFAAAGSYVSEQSGSTVGTFMRQTAGSGWVFIMAMAGLSMLAMKQFRFSLLLLPMAIVASLSLEAIRFQIFAAPLLAIGLGTIIYVLWNRLGNKMTLKLIVVSLLSIAALWTNVFAVQQQNRTVPRRIPQSFDGMLKIREKTPENAVIWSSWGTGHPLVHYTDRGTIADGIYHPSELVYITSYPLSIDNDRLAANWMQFYVAHGLEGFYKANRLFTGTRHNWNNGTGQLQKLLKAGPAAAAIILKKDHPGLNSEDTLGWLFPGSKRPIVLFINNFMARATWYQSGQWDFATGAQPPPAFYRPVYQFQSNPEKRTLTGHTSKGNITVYPERGVVQIYSQLIPLNRLSLFTGKKRLEKTFNKDAEISVSAYLPAKIAVVGKKEKINTNMTKWFFELKYDKQYFTPVSIAPGIYAIISVNGDKYPSVKSNQSG